MESFSAEPLRPFGATNLLIISCRHLHLLADGDCRFAVLGWATRPRQGSFVQTWHRSNYTKVDLD
jgi:hypothetical protein